MDSPSDSSSETRPHTLSQSSNTSAGAGDGNSSVSASSSSSPSTLNTYYSAEDASYNNGNGNGNGSANYAGLGRASIESTSSVTSSYSSSSSSAPSAPRPSNNLFTPHPSLASISDSPVYASAIPAAHHHHQHAQLPPQPSSASSLPDHPSSAAQPAFPASAAASAASTPVPGSADASLPSTASSSSIVSMLSSMAATSSNPSASVASVASVGSATTASGGRLSKQEREKIRKELKKDEEFHSYFKIVPENEGLIDDFSCALQREILVQGRMYISQNWLCFYASILGWETSIAVQFKDIVNITKEKTALVIPNAIQIATESSKHTFASIISRDQVYSKLVTVWKAHHKEDSSMYLGISDDVSRKQSTSDDEDIAPRHSRKSSEGNDLDEAPAKPRATRDSAVPASRASSDSSEGATLPSSASTASFIQSQPQSQSQSASQGMGVSPAASSSAASSSDAAPQEAGSSSGDASASAVAEPPAIEYPSSPVECGCGSSDHLPLEYTNEVIDADVEAIHDMLFTESELYLAYCKSKNTTDLVTENWHKDENGETVRDIKYLLELHKAMGPKNAICIEKQKLLSKVTHARFVAETLTSTPYVPYGDTFATLSRYCVSFVAPGKSRVRVTCQIKYLKSVNFIAKKFIESNTMEGLQEHYSSIFNLMKSFIAQGKVPSGSKQQRQQLAPAQPQQQTQARPQEEQPPQQQLQQSRQPLTPQVHDQPKPSFSTDLTPSSSHEPSSSTAATGFMPWLSSVFGNHLLPVTFLLLVFCTILLSTNLILFVRLVYIEDKLMAYHDTVALDVGTIIKNSPNSSDEWLALLRHQSLVNAHKQAHLLEAMKRAQRAFAQLNILFDVASQDVVFSDGTLGETHASGNAPTKRAVHVDAHVDL